MTRAGLSQRVLYSRFRESNGTVLHADSQRQRRIMASMARESFKLQLDFCVLTIVYIPICVPLCRVLRIASRALLLKR